MIDAVLKFADKATAMTALAQHVGSDGQGAQIWLSDHIIPDVQIWRRSQDVTDAQGKVTHTYLVGYFVLVSLPDVVPALRDRPEVQVVIDRDKANARQAGAVLKSNVTNAVLQDIIISPVFAGTDLPYGNMK